jgi:hypothetical protein
MYSKAQDVKVSCKSRTDLFGALTHDNTAPLVILQRTVGMAHHLKHVIDGVIHITGRRRGRRRGERRQRHINRETTHRSPDGLPHHKKNRCKGGAVTPNNNKTVYELVCLGTCSPTHYFSF